MNKEDIQSLELIRKVLFKIRNRIINKQEQEIKLGRIDGLIIEVQETIDKLIDTPNNEYD